MFDDEDDDSGEKFLKEDLEQFESYLKGVQIGFMDSDRIEAIVDHYLVNGIQVTAIRNPLVFFLIRARMSNF